MNKSKLLSLFALVLAALVFTGCAALEVGWKIGVTAGEKLLPEEQKEKVKPYKEAIEDGYIIYKDAKEGNGAITE